MHAFYLREAMRSLRQHSGLATTAILSLTAALTLVGLFLLLTHNAQVALQFIGDRREMVVYLRDEVNDAQRDALIKRLTDLFGEVSYVSKDDAWKEFAQQVGDPQLLEAVGQNPLPASLRVRLRSELLNAPAMAEAARQVQAFPEVEDVRYGAEWVSRLDALGTGFRQGAIGMGIVVALAIVFVLYNTLRLTVLARRHQVEIMSRLGATDGFVARPFVIEAVFEAVVAAVFALAALYAIQRALAFNLVGVVFLPWTWMVAFVGAAVALAWLAATLALSRVLRSVGP
jgi:cell division transport system permease protein